LEPREILKKYWQYDAFRPLQEDIINSVLAGNDTLALLPTGGGKSICFQVPSLAREGICIVVSPLIALMKDQVANLQRRGIKAIAVYSGMNAREIDIAIDNCVYGHNKFLYLSPERLTTDIVRARLPKMKVNLLAIDEAHCISQWGYDFRPPYLQIAEIREILPQIPVLALTATATPDVITDICEKLVFRDHKIFVKSFERKNLTYAVLKEENKLERLLRICNRVPGTGIVYVRNRKKTREIAEFLQYNKISASYYHAGLDATTRDNRQDEWVQEKIRVIVSTNAFGMGIDKPNVRFVVHMDLPDSPEAYFQEAGRGGRDEKRAFAVLLYNKSDLLDLARAHENSFPPIDFIKNIYNALGNYLQLAMGSGRDLSYDFVLQDFCSHYNLDRIKTFNALVFLEKEGYITLSEAFSSPSRIMVLLDKEELYRFMVANPLYDILLKILLRSYAGLFTDFTRIHEEEITKRLSVGIDELTRHLNRLHQLRVLYYEPANSVPRITFNSGRLNASDLSISPENYKNRKKSAGLRVNAMHEYVTSENICRSTLLLQYFGETPPPPCGKCDVCTSSTRNEITATDLKNISSFIVQELRNKQLTIGQLINNLKAPYPEKKVIATIQWMKDTEKLILNPENETLRLSS